RGALFLLRSSHSACNHVLTLDQSTLCASIGDSHHTSIGKLRSPVTIDIGIPHCAHSGARSCSRRKLSACLRSHTERAKGRSAKRPQSGHAQATFCHRRHQPSRPPHAKIKPGRPAPTVGAGTLAGLTTTDRLSMSSVPIAPPLPKELNELFWFMPGVKVKH